MLLPASPPQRCPPHCRCTAHRAAHLTAAVLPASLPPQCCSSCHAVLLLPMSRRCSSCRRRAVAPCRAVLLLPVSLRHCLPHCCHTAHLAATALPTLPPRRCSSCR